MKKNLFLIVVIMSLAACAMTVDFKTFFATPCPINLSHIDDAGVEEIK